MGVAPIIMKNRIIEDAGPWRTTEEGRQTARDPQEAERRSRSEGAVIHLPEPGADAEGERQTPMDSPLRFQCLYDCSGYLVRSRHVLQEGFDEILTFSFLI